MIALRAHPKLRIRLFRRLPVGALCPDVGDAGLAEAHPGPHTPKEAVGLGELVEHVHHAAVEEREVAGVQRDLHVGGRPEGAVEGLVGDLQEPARLALHPHPVDDVVAFLPLLVKGLDDLRWVLQVAVEQHDRVAGGRLHPARERSREPKLRLWLITRTFGSISASFSRTSAGVVGAGVVDEDDLVVDAELLERRGETLVHLRDRRRVPVAGDDCGQAVRRAVGHGVSPPRSPAPGRRARSSPDPRPTGRAGPPTTPSAPG